MFLPSQLNVPFAEVPWRATIAIGAAGAAELVGLTDPGGEVTHDAEGHYHLTFPESQTVFVESISVTAGADGPDLSDVHIQDIAPGTAHIHTAFNGTGNLDLAAGALIFVKLLLRNP